MSSTHIAHIATWFEIPATDLDRAAKFYGEVFGQSFKRETFGPDMVMEIFEAPEGAIKGALVHSPNHRPSADGSLVYLNGGADLADPLSRVEAAGGQIRVAKTKISDTCGSFAVFVDSEGNRVGLYSMG